MFGKKKPVPAPKPHSVIEGPMEVQTHTAPIKLVLSKTFYGSMWDGNKQVQYPNTNTYDFLLDVESACKVRDALDKVLTDLGR